MIENLTAISINAYQFLLPFASIAAVIAVVILIPMAFFKATRRASGKGFFFLSFLFGITTWLLGAAVTLIAWGWWGVIIGIFLLGIGVVPIGILAAFISLDEPSLGISLIVMTVIVMAARFGGAVLIEKSYAK